MDLKTYQCKVTVKDGRTLTLNIDISSGYEDEDDVAEGAIYMYTMGNFSCDCNLSNLLGDDELPCGKTMAVKKIVLIRPDKTQRVIYGGWISPTPEKNGSFWNKQEL